MDELSQPAQPVQPVGFFHRVKRGFWLLMFLGLAAAVLYLRADLNHRQYRLAEQQGQLVIERGRFLPWGFEPFVPEAEPLRRAYAPLVMPVGQSFGPPQEFDDRQDLDRAMFGLIAGWAREHMGKREIESAREYVTRAEDLPGLAETQRQELGILRADLAFESGEEKLRGVARALELALNEYENALRLGTTRGELVRERIAEVRARLGALQGTMGDAGVAPEGELPKIELPVEPVIEAAQK